MSFLLQLTASRGPAACFLGMGVVWGAFMAAMPDIKAGLGMADGPFGLLLIWGSVTAIAMMTLAPRAARRVGRAALPGFAALMAGALGLMAFAGTPVLFLLALMAMGLSSGALDVFMNARLSAIEAARGEPLMNLNHALYSLGFAGAAALTGLARAAGWGASEILTVAALATFALALLSIDRAGWIEGMDPGPRQGRVALGLVPWLGGALILAALMSENAVEAWSALYIERDLGGATGSGSLAPALMGLTMGFGRLAGQGLARRLPERRLLGGGMLIAVAGLLVVVAATGPLIAYAGFVVMGLGGSVVVPTAIALTGRLADPAARGRAIARATVLGYLGYFLGPPMLGLLAELAGLRASFAFVAGVMALALLAARALLRRA